MDIWQKIPGMINLIMFSTFFLVIPLCLTIYNFYNFITTMRWSQNLQKEQKPLKLYKKQKLQKLASLTTMILGPLFMVILYSMWGPTDWQKPIVIGAGELELHAPVAGPFMPTIIFLALAAISGFILLYLRKTRLPPLMIVFCVAALYIGCGLGIIFVVQLVPNINEAHANIPFEGYLMILFPVNFIVLSVRLLRDVMIDLVKDITERSKSDRLHLRIVLKGLNLPALALLAMFPLLGICITILALFGQQPDAIVKAFTETSDWLFSMKVSPPPVEYSGHYLCTVAAGGHEKIVKPQRIGIRQGHHIIVNRQLCVANAFEQLISERAPRFHRIVRQLYDHYGYPLSKRIRTPFAADLIYILMKPLEWIFLTALYLFDLNPENRIAKQYLPNPLAPRFLDS